MNTSSILIVYIYDWDTLHTLATAKS